MPNAVLIQSSSELGRARLSQMRCALTLRPDMRPLNHELQPLLDDFSAASAQVRILLLTSPT